jgi:hypothetical protein
LDSTNYVNYPVKNPYGLKLTNITGNIINYDGSAAIDLSDGVYNAVHLKNKASIAAKDSSGNFRRVSDVKTDLKEIFGTITSGIGSSVVIPSETITNWSDDNWTFTHGASYTAIKLS